MNSSGKVQDEKKENILEDDKNDFQLKSFIQEICNLTNSNADISQTQFEELHEILRTLRQPIPDQSLDENEEQTRLGLVLFTIERINSFKKNKKENFARNVIESIQKHKGLFCNENQDFFQNISICSLKKPGKKQIYYPFGTLYKDIQTNLSKSQIKELKKFFEKKQDSHWISEKQFKKIWEILRLNEGVKDPSFLWSLSKFLEVFGINAPKQLKIFEPQPKKTSPKFINSAPGILFTSTYTKEMYEYEMAQIVGDVETMKELTERVNLDSLIFAFLHFINKKNKMRLCDGLLSAMQYEKELIDPLQEVLYQFVLMNEFSNFFRYDVIERKNLKSYLISKMVENYNITV